MATIKPPNPPAQPAVPALTSDQLLAQTAAQCAATITAALATRVYGTPNWNQQLLDLNKSFYDQVRGFLPK
jgi:hypothetical protein